MAAARVRKSLGRSNAAERARRIGQALGLATRHLARSGWSSIECLCAFVGQPRSGHTFVGSVLDAHPSMCIATEADAFGMVERGWGRDALFNTLGLHARFVADVLGNRSAGYDYRIGAHQGRWEDLRVIGDNMAGRTVDRLHAHPDLVERIQSLTGVRLRLVHVVRNPFDTIATMYNRSHAGRAEGATGAPRQPDPLTLQRRVVRYFERARAVEALKARDLEVITVRHEAYIQNPRREFARLLEFLGMPAPDRYLELCAKRTLPVARRTRSSLVWPDDVRDHVTRSAAGLSHLAGYSFE